MLWLLNAPYRRIYQPNHDDVTALADGLLLLPGAHWPDWFTRGHSYFFDTYPEWPQHDTAFSRPVFQSVVYFAHFFLDRDWASYLAINYVAIAGVGAMAFAIARTAAGLGTGASVFAAALTLMSSAILEFSVGVLGAGSECLSAVLVGGGFLAVVARRDALCAVLLLLALLTKETSVWAPFAACLTVLFRPEGGGAARRAISAALMLGPFAVWLGSRLAFYGGIGGTYATADYIPVIAFLKLTLLKIRHLHHLFIAQAVAASDWRSPLLDSTIRIGAALLIVLLLTPWVIGSLRNAFAGFSRARRQKRWPLVDADTLVAIWATIGLAFYFALPLSSPRYAAASVMFGWPSIVSEVERRRSVILRGALAACIAISLAQTSRLLAASNPPTESEQGKFFHAAAAMNAALRQTPASMRDIYVISTGGLVPVNSEYLRALTGIPAEITRIVDAAWECGEKGDSIAFDNEIVGPTVTLVARLPDCARFFFAFSGIDANALVDGGIRRNESIAYKVPDARAIERQGLQTPGLEIGRNMTVLIHLRGPARFIIERGAPDGSIAWFDAPG